MHLQQMLSRLPNIQLMLSRLPVARKDAILLFIAGILMLVVAFRHGTSVLGICIAAIAIARGSYKWMTSPTIEAQVAVPLFTKEG